MGTSDLAVFSSKLSDGPRDELVRQLLLAAGEATEMGNTGCEARAVILRSLAELFCSHLVVLAGVCQLCIANVKTDIEAAASLRISVSTRDR